MKNSKIILIATSLLIIAMFTACGSILPTKKLALTKENIQKVFVNAYGVEIYLLDSPNKSISANFYTKTDIPKDKVKDALVQIKSNLHKNFDMSNNNIIEIDTKEHTLIKDNKGKIQIGDLPQISIQEPTLYIPQMYSMSTKFNILTLNRDDMKITATDYEDGDLTNKIKLKNSNVLTKIGKQTLIYEVTDSDGNTITNNDLSIEVTK